MQDIVPLNPKKPVPRLTGSSVPVTAVHIPKAATARPPVQPAPEKRPLFYNKETPTPTVSRVGYKERRLLLIIGVLLLTAVALAGFIFLPKADIRMVLRTAPLLVDQQLTVRANGGSEANTIPGTAFFREIQLEGDSPVTSTQIVGTKAKGSVRIVNSTSEEQKIKEQSRLVTNDGVLFYMQQHAIIQPNSSTTVIVEAAEAGEKGNISSQRLRFAALPAGTATLLYADVPTPLTGGTGKSVAVVQETDINEAKRVAGDQVKAQAEQEIKQELPKGWALLQESWNVEPQAFEVNAAVGDQKDSVHYTARITARVLGYEEEQLKKNLEQALNDRLDKEYMLFPGAISSTQTVKAVDWEKAEGVISARVTHTTIPRFSVDALRTKLAGRSSKEAKAYLEGLPGVRSSEIKLWPFWVQSIPHIEKRVNIDLQPDQAS